MSIGALGGAAAAAAAGAGAGAAADGWEGDDFLNPHNFSFTALRLLASNNRVVVHAPDHGTLVGYLRSEGKPFPKELIALILQYSGKNIYTTAPNVTCRGLQGEGFTFSRGQANGDLQLGVLHAAGMVFSVRSLEEGSGPPATFGVPFLDDNALGDSRLALTREGAFRAPVDYVPYTTFLKYPAGGAAGEVTIEPRGWDKQSWGARRRPNDACTRIDAYTYDAPTAHVFTMHEEGRYGMTVARDGFVGMFSNALLFEGKRVLAALGIPGETLCVYSVTTTGIFKMQEVKEARGEPLEEEIHRGAEVVKGAYRTATYTPDRARFVMQDQIGCVSTYTPATSASSTAFQVDFPADFMATNRHHTVALLPRDASRCSLWDLELGVPLLTLHPAWESPVESDGFALSDSSLCISWIKGGLFKERHVAVYDLRAPAAKPVATTTQS